MMMMIYEGDRGVLAGTGHSSTGIEERPMYVRERRVA